MDIRYHVIPDFAFEDGTVLPSVRVAYAVLNPSAARTALVITCFRGRLDNTCTFAGGALQGHRVVIAALLGNGESSSPSNTPGFPQATLRYQDCVRAHEHLLRTALHVEQLDIVLGFSMGAQAAYHWLLMYPAMVRRAVVICGSARTSAHNVQFLEGPRAALENAVDYVPPAARTGRATPPPPCVRGIHAFGKAYSAWLTSAEWFDQEGFRALGFASRADWDAVTTGPNYRGWDPDDLLALLGMWQRGDVTMLVPATAHADRLRAALGSIQVPVLLMPSETDQYFRWYMAEREAGMMPQATLKVIPSVWGHLAGSGANPVDTQWMDEQIRSFISQ